MIPLQGVTAEELARRVAGLALEDARRIVAQVHRDEDPSDAELGHPAYGAGGGAARGYVPQLEVVTERRSQLDPFVKYALRTADGHVVETVRIPLEHPGRFSSA